MCAFSVTCVYALIGELAIIKNSHYDDTGRKRKAISTQIINISSEKFAHLVTDGTLQ